MRDGIVPYSCIDREGTTKRLPKYNTRPGTSLTREVVTQACWVFLKCKINQLLRGMLGYAVIHFVSELTDCDISNGTMLLTSLRAHEHGGYYCQYHVFVPHAVLKRIDIQSQSSQTGFSSPGFWAGRCRWRVCPVALHWTRSRT